VKADVIISDQGSVILFRLMTKKAHTWVRENLEIEGWAWLGNSFAVDHRNAEVVIAMMEDHEEGPGLRVQ
jgi:hypothetical protein